ncbi:MAG: hypothetical protein QM664_01860 [Flavihumibacter sp.]
MKTSSNQLFAAISDKNLQSLTREVKETVATDLSDQVIKRFKPVNLWKIQQQRKPAATRRRAIANLAIA